jgi:hypothetical protein
VDVDTRGLGCAGAVQTRGSGWKMAVDSMRVAGFVVRPVMSVVGSTLSMKAVVTAAVASKDYWFPIASVAL